jgi:spore coat protein U-like protein
MKHTLFKPHIKSALLVVSLATAAIAYPAINAFAAFATADFQVQITITNACAISGVNDLDFGSQGSLAAAIASTSTFSVNCTTDLPYTIGLNAGTGAGATVANRLMTGPSSATVAYSLYQDASHLTVWGDSIGTDTVAGTGTGTDVLYTVFGQVPAQTTPAAGTYSDTITITVTF